MLSFIWEGRPIKVAVSELGASHEVFVRAGDISVLLDGSCQYNPDSWLNVAGLGLAGLAEAALSYVTCAKSTKAVYLHRIVFEVDGKPWRVYVDQKAKDRMWVSGSDLSSCGDQACFEQVPWDQVASGDYSLSRSFLDQVRGSVTAWLESSLPLPNVGVPWRGRYYRFYCRPGVPADPSVSVDDLRKVLGLAWKVSPTQFSVPCAEVLNQCKSLGSNPDALDFVSKLEFAVAFCSSLDQPFLTAVTQPFLTSVTAVKPDQLLAAFSLFNALAESAIRIGWSEFDSVLIAGWLVEKTHGVNVHELLSRPGVKASGF